MTLTTLPPSLARVVFAAAASSLGRAVFTAADWLWDGRACKYVSATLVVAIMRGWIDAGLHDGNRRRGNERAMAATKRGRCFPGGPREVNIDVQNLGVAFKLIVTDACQPARERDPLLASKRDPIAAARARLIPD